jgi:hypothetical protein
MCIVQQRKPNQEPPIDLVEQFYKENVDLKAILNSRKARKEVTAGLEPYTGEFGACSEEASFEQDNGWYGQASYG